MKNSVRFILIALTIAGAALIAESKQATVSNRFPDTRNRSGEKAASLEATKNDEPKVILEFDVLSGSPQKAGSPFVIRMKIADGGKILPHWHPVDENITVISGTLFMGRGEKFDQSKGEEMRTGGYMLIPREEKHYMWARGETVVQIHGIGPFRTYWVGPSEEKVKAKPGSNQVN
jgi:quercetin dioxygenase-like cupin family protein